jgi:hypothetical protein
MASDIEYCIKPEMSPPSKTPRKAITASEGTFRKSMTNPIKMATARIVRDDRTLTQMFIFDLLSDA